MRKITLTGHIVADAEKKVTSTGREYITFRFANNEYNDEKGSDGKPITYWFKITSFNQNHFNLSKYLTKGKYIILSGSFSDRIYQNSKGLCDISRDIIADYIDFINTGTNNETKHNTTTTNSIPEVTSTPKKVENINITATTNKIDDDVDDLPF